MKKITILLLILILTLAACSGNTVDLASAIENAQPAAASDEIGDTTVTDQQATAATAIPVTAKYDNEDLDSTPLNPEDTTFIQLNGGSITVDDTDATVDGSNITISAAGTYQISGVLDDGQIIVDTQDAESVVLLLDGVDITSSTSGPIYVKNAEKTVITLADGTENYVTDGEAYILEDPAMDEPNAAIFSKDDLTINSDGSLIVTANYNNGIDSNDDLLITGGSITVNAVNDGIKGKDSIAVLDGNISIHAGGDGMQSNNAEDPEEGYIVIENGTFDISAGLDGIQAETRVLVSGGDFTIRTSGDSSVESAKGIKAGVDLSITGGTFNISAADDALHSNDSLTIDEGIFSLASGDDGIHAEYALTINGGDIRVIQAFEGFESALITINDGNVHLVTSDDGLNATTGNGGGQADSSYFYLNGGSVLIDADGDGLDSNGTAVITGGVVIVQGPTSQKNGPLDVNGELFINGGILIAAGSASMAEIPSESSTQNAIALVLDSTQAAGTIIHVESESGEEILTYESPKEFQLFVFSSPELQANTTYNVYIGGTATGTVTDGLYVDGTYTAGTLVASLEITSSITALGSFDQSFGGGRGDKQRP